MITVIRSQAIVMRLQTFGRPFAIGTALNIGFVVIQVVFGLLRNHLNLRFHGIRRQLQREVQLFEHCAAIMCYIVR